AESAEKIGRQKSAGILGPIERGEKEVPQSRHYFFRIDGLYQSRGLGSNATFSITSRRSWSGSHSHSCAITWRSSHVFASLTSRSSGDKSSVVISALLTSIRSLASSNWRWKSRKPCTSKWIYLARKR